MISAIPYLGRICGGYHVTNWRIARGGATSCCRCQLTTTDFRKFSVKYCSITVSRLMTPVENDVDTDESGGWLRRSKLQYDFMFVWGAYLYFASEVDLMNRVVGEVRPHIE